MGLAFDYIIDDGIETEKEYPYEGYDDTCKAKAADEFHPISSWCSVKPKDADALKAAIAHGPVSVAIEADTMVF